MANGVDFCDGEQVNPQATSTQQRNIGSSGGPVDFVDGDGGRSSNVVVDNEEGMPMRGGALDSPMDM